MEIQLNHQMMNQPKKKKKIMSQVHVSIKHILLNWQIEEIFVELFMEFSMIEAKILYTYINFKNNLAHHKCASFFFS